VRLDDRLIEILKTHSAWRLESGNHPPGAAMPDFSKVIAAAPLTKVDPARVALSWK
jgi:NitT/TauT family transport system substrate-binding protein